MRTLVALFTVANLLMPAPPAADMSGTWDLTMSWSGDTRSTGVCTFSQIDETLTGTCGSDDKFPITGAVTDKRVTWESEVAQDGNKGQMAFDGELDDAGTTVKGSCRIVGARQGTFTLVKRR
jgi:hypothetical protein